MLHSDGRQQQQMSTDNKLLGIPLKLPLGCLVFPCHLKRGSWHPAPMAESRLTKHGIEKFKKNIRAVRYD